MRLQLLQRPQLPVSPLAGGDDDVGDDDDDDDNDDKYDDYDKYDDHDVAVESAGR